MPRDRPSTASHTCGQMREWRARAGCSKKQRSAGRALLTRKTWGVRNQLAFAHSPDSPQDKIACYLLRTPAKIPRDRKKNTPVWTQSIALLVSFECKIYCLTFAGGHRDLLCHGSELLVPGFHRVFPGRKVGQVEASVLAGYRIIRMLEHRDVALHPGMHVAFHGNRDLLARETFLHRGAGRLRLVPLPVVSRNRMNVVGGVVAVDHLQLLIRAHGHHVRLIDAAFLLERHRLGGDRKSTRLNSSHT